MKKVEIEYTIKVNKNIYENFTNLTPQNLVEVFLMPYIGLSYEQMVIPKNYDNKEVEQIYKNYFQELSETDKVMYHAYLEVLKEIKENFTNSYRIEVKDLNNEIQEIKILGSILHDENTKLSLPLNAIIKAEIFNSALSKYYDLIEELKKQLKAQKDMNDNRNYKGNHPDRMNTEEFLLKIYQTLENAIIQAKPTLIVNGENVNGKSFP